jgi:hypothetical protein
MQPVQQQRAQPPITLLIAVLSLSLDNVCGAVTLSVGL